MASTVRYQILLLDPGATGQAETLQRTLRTRLEELGIDLETAVAFRTDTELALAREWPAPTAAVYFGRPGVEADAATEGLLATLIDDGVLVVPVVPDLKMFSVSVPEVLHPVNGTVPAVDDPGLDAIAGVVLQGLKLLRDRRGLFISYRRAESSGVALQLHDALSARGFDVFLDTHSVPVGARFQDELWHRLSDVDVMVLLDTPAFITSEWTKKELATANNSEIGIVQAIWPGQTTVAKAALGLPLLLAEADFQGGAPGPNAEDRLTEAAVARIATAVESHRARCLAARHIGLIQAFCKMAEAQGVAAAVQPERYIRLKVRGSRRSTIVIPQTGVPTSRSYHDVHGRRQQERRGTKMALLYNHLGIRRDWLDHLAWLNRWCPVRSVRLAEVKEWLEAIRPS